MKSRPFGKTFVRLRRVLVIGFVLSYLGTGVFFLYQHLLGTSGSTAWAYVWTWDMFPNYPSFSARRFALGQTESGRFLKVFPTSKIQFRRGANGEHTRFDLPRNDAALRKAVQETLESARPQNREDPVTYVFLVEKYWPVRFNLPEPLYQKAFGEENPHRSSYRILDEGSVEETGEVRWTSSP